MERLTRAEDSGRALQRGAGCAYHLPRAKDYPEEDKRVGDSSEPRPSDGMGQGRESAAGGDTLEDAAREARDVARQSLRNELGRDPSDEEVDEWLRSHTEGY